MSEKSINKALYKLAHSVLNEGLYQRHDSATMLVPFMFLKTKTSEDLKTLDPDADPLKLAQTIISSGRKNYTHIIIANEASLNDTNGNRVEAIIINAFDLSLKKGIQIAQKFNSINTGEFKKIGKIETLDSPDLIFKLQKSADIISIQKKPHFNTEIRNDRKELVSIYTELSHHDPNRISEVIHSFILEKLSNIENGNYNGLFEINIKETEPIKNIGLLRFLCTNAINELLGSETSNNWIKKTHRKLIITCNYNNEILYQARTSETKPDFIKLDDDNLEKQLYQKLELEAIDTKKNTIEKLTTKPYKSKKILKVAKSFMIASTALLVFFLSWFFLIKK